MAMLAQQHKKLPRLAGACGSFLLFRGQHDGGGMGGCFASSITGKGIVDNIILNPKIR
jgi:hypothetical protein